MDRDRHLFPGGNTPDGFFSYYQYILPQDEAKHIFCIKGGPGVGKSTFMKKIGEEMGGRGYPVEHLHCSSDPGSLDGLVIPGLSVAFIDGTAPHVVDPKNPGAVDEIVNLGEHWDLAGIKEHRQDILADNAEVGRTFARAYRYLGAAKRIYDDYHTIHDECTDAWAADAEAELALPSLGDGKGSRRGRERRMFASAITPDGLVHYLGSLIVGYERIYEVQGAGRQPAAFLSRVKDEALRRGLDVETFYCPMEPAGKPEHVLIPALQLAFTSANRYHAVPKLPAVRVDFGKYLDKQKLSGYSETLMFDAEQFERLMQRAVAALHDAKALHDHMETFYIPNMDFDAISRCREEIVKRVIAFAGK